VLPGHEPTLAQMEDAGVVRIDGTDGRRLTVAVHGGFLSITPESVTVLAEFAEFAEEIDVSRARSALDQADESDAEGAAAARRAQARLRAAGAAE
jgi:F-type H+-transporting ATPase subunit epsilon